MYASLVLFNPPIEREVEYESNVRGPFVISGLFPLEDNEIIEIIENTETPQTIIVLKVSGLTVTNRISSAPIQVISNTGDNGMETRIGNVETNISKINGRLDSIDETLKKVNEAVNSLRGVPSQAKVANIIATLVFVSLAIIAGLFWNNISSLSGNLTTLDDRVYKLTEDVSVIKTDGGHIKADIKELKENTNSKLDRLLDRSPDNH